MSLSILVLPFLFLEQWCLELLLLLPFFVEDTEAPDGCPVTRSVHVDKLGLGEALLLAGQRHSVAPKIR